MKDQLENDISESESVYSDSRTSELEEENKQLKLERDRAMGENETAVANAMKRIEELEGIASMWRDEATEKDRKHQKAMVIIFQIRDTLNSFIESQWPDMVRMEELNKKRLELGEEFLEKEHPCFHTKFDAHFSREDLKPCNGDGWHLCEEECIHYVRPEMFDKDYVKEGVFDLNKEGEEAQ